MGEKWDWLERRRNGDEKALTLFSLYSFGLLEFIPTRMFLLHNFKEDN